MSNLSQAYEGQNQNYIINNLKNDTNYDIRICSNLIMFTDYGPKLAKFYLILKRKMNI